MTFLYDLAYCKRAECLAFIRTEKCLRVTKLSHIKLNSPASLYTSLRIASILNQKTDFKPVETGFEAVLEQILALPRHTYC